MTSRRGGEPPWPVGVPGRVELPDGRVVVGSAAAGVADLRPAPQLVVRLDRAVPTGTWQTLDVDWPDFRLPRDTATALGTLRRALDRADEERVVVACLGGRGRTGTAMAALAVVAGVDPGQAVTWVRHHYRPDAIETRRQQRWVRRLP